MTDDTKYMGTDGNQISLDALCRKEPAWAANVIRTLKAEKHECQTRLEELLNAAELVDRHESLGCVTGRSLAIQIDLCRRSLRKYGKRP